MAASSEHSESPLQRWKKLLGVRIHDVLKPQGFRRRGFTWYRENEDTRWLVNLQSSRDSSSEYLIAYVNVAVQSKVLWSRMVPGREMPLDVWTHHYWRRLEPDASGAWRIRSDTQAQRSAEEIASLLQSIGREFFDRYGTTELLYWFWREGTRGPDPCHERTSAEVAYLKDLFEPALLSPSPVEARLLSSLEAALQEHGFFRGGPLHFCREQEASRVLVEVSSAPASQTAYYVFLKAGIQYQELLANESRVGIPSKEQWHVSVSVPNPSPGAWLGWLVASEEEADAAADSMKGALLRNTLPLFEQTGRFGTLAQLAKEWHGKIRRVDPQWRYPTVHRLVQPLLDSMTQ